MSGTKVKCSCGSTEFYQRRTEAIVEYACELLELDGEVAVGEMDDDFELEYENGAHPPTYRCRSCDELVKVEVRW